MQKSRIIRAGLALAAVFLSACASTTSTQMNAPASPAKQASVASFHQRAQAGEPLNIVFLGGSLTWGANASDPQITSYRGRMTSWLREQYPNTPLHIHDAAIGGTGSDLALFRLERDVLAHDPDLVFLDFTVNDNAGGTDHERLACYETLMRRILDSDAALIQVTMMFKWHVSPEKDGNEFPPRLRDHIALGKTYNVPVANVIPHVRQTVKEGTAIETLWPFDGAHPDDPGYELFFEAVRDRYVEAAQDKSLVATIPNTPVYGDRYAIQTRALLKDHPLPDGWEIKKTWRTALWFDGQASRWMGDVATASKENESAALDFEFKGSLVGFFGERDSIAPDVKIWIDGELVLPPNAKKDQTTWHMASDRFAPVKKGSGRLFIWNLIADDLEDGPHTLKIEPVWDGADDSAELRIESICYAGKAQ
ncbi:SGNH/GDSL hydrolase family protein [Coraliomargarita parva]|uniref:SGNH/GDSL hydrolase family protein n=1 Tax=Coraliomargarita parva TaxID=3014050 RepID=UPI0022B2E892|nr:SGNH/GDSL hydrolase family protein [Coraliomargarita parva]